MSLSLKDRTAIPFRMHSFKAIHIQNKTNKLKIYMSVLSEFSQ